MKKRPGLRKAAYDMARQGWKPPMDWDKQQPVQNARRLDYLERSQKLLHFVRKFNEIQKSTSSGRGQRPSGFA